jgi:hypothetical protein
VQQQNKNVKKPAAMIATGLGRVIIGRKSDKLLKEQMR